MNSYILDMNRKPYVFYSIIYNLVFLEKQSKNELQLHTRDCVRPKIHSKAYKDTTTVKRPIYVSWFAPLQASRHTFILNGKRLDVNTLNVHDFYSLCENSKKLQGIMLISFPKKIK